MKKLQRLLLLGIALGAFARSHAAQPTKDFSHIDASIPPFYVSLGPKIAVGRFSSGLASTKEEEVLTTITMMKKNWDRLTVIELYAAAIRLYDLGYRKESIYWYYSARLRESQVVSLLARGVDVELVKSHNLFYRAVRPYIEGYGFEDVDGLVKIIEKVKEEGVKIPDLKAAYPGVELLKTKLESTNDQLVAMMQRLASSFKANKENIQRTRIEEGDDKLFAGLTNKEFPSR